MPQSRRRHKHPHHHSQHATHTHSRKSTRRSAVSIMIVFIAILGTVIAFISAGTDITWLLTGAIAGGITGYFIGRSMDRVAAKNR